MSLQRTILITGAASGIGAATARRFADAGWFVGLFDLNADAVERLAAELGEHCCFGPVDVTHKEKVEDALATFSSATGGRLDVLINSAGLFQDERLIDADPDYLDLMMDVNMNGVVNCMRAAYPLLKSTPGSHVVNLGSSSSIYGVPNSAIYSATKFFVRGLTEALRIEWEEDDITVNVVMPSYVASPMTDGIELSHDSSDMLTVDEVVDAVWEAATTDGMYWVLPRSARMGAFLSRKVPMAWAPAVARRFFYNKAS